MQKFKLMETICKYIKNYTILAICFAVAIFLVKFFETAMNFEAVSSFSGFVYCNLISCGFMISAVFIVYVLISLFSKKAALYVSAVLLGIMMMTEVGLIIYYQTTGILMGKELILRPLWEMVHTVKSAVNIWMMIGVVVVLVLYVIVSVRLSKKNIKDFVTYLMMALCLVSIPLFFVINVNHDKIVVNKTMYCIRQCVNKTELDLGLAKTDFDAKIIKNYLAMFPDRQVVDIQYPLERKDNIKNVLGPYFKESECKPNVVVMIVESLGSDMLQYMPFVDSLSKHSLFWNNCMATTPRSFGAVPAVTGSVPHGLKGFQFGNIPNHNSLFTVLANNGYSTNVFYAGNFSFDRVYDYLVAQHVDYMSPLYEEHKSGTSDSKDGTYWGFNDDVMLQKSLNVIKSRDNSKPSCDLFVTITQHEDLNLYDKDLQKTYYDAATALGVSPKLTGLVAAAIYSDNALRRFMKRYLEFDKNDNTIFVITGDHSLNLNPNNPLDAFHVPLLIYSPLLEKTDHFEAMVSHNDITPSVLALLRDNFGVETPETVSWVSDGLDTIAGFHSNIRNYFLHYSRELKDFVWNDNYFTLSDKVHPLARIVDGVDVKPFDNQELAADLENKFKTMVYVDNYVYSNNRIIKHPVSDNDDFEIIKTVKLPDSVYCASKSEKPSVDRPETTVIYKNVFNKKCSEIKLVLTADVMYTGNVWQDAFISLVVECNGEGMNKVYSTDYISKYIMNRTPEPDKWQKLEMSKIISVDDVDKFELKAYMLPTFKDDVWNPDHSVLLKNVNIKILGVKTNTQ